MTFPSDGRLWPVLSALGLAAAVAACSSNASTADSTATSNPAAMTPRLFTRLPSSVTGVRFQNVIDESNERNVFTYRNFYNGGGVAIGDLTGDGRPEIVLTSNEKGPKLFLNEGSFHFRDVTEDAGIAAEKDTWSTGVSLADVNGDGRLDIYICRAGPLPPAQRANQLWINEGVNARGVPTFEEKAREYSVADEGFSTQAVFFDYDHDGDLDLFLVIYLSNDFIELEYHYINKHQRTFSEALEQQPAVLS
jgi:hypothetical protein